MKKTYNHRQWLMFVLILSLFYFVLLAGCQFIEPPPKEEAEDPKLVDEPEDPDKQITSPEVGDGSEMEHRELTPEAIVKIYGDSVFRHGDRKTKTLALTFDDGPDNDYTPRILDVLKEFQVKATFFIIGLRADQYPDVLQRIHAEGHQIASHSYHHYKMSNLTPQKIMEELELVNRTLKRETGIQSYVFRPPYGAIDAELIETVRGEGFYVILWDIDSLDWRSLRREQVLANVLSELHSGAIILQHSAGGPGEDLTGTVEALPLIITSALQQGYKFVTINEMFASRMVVGEKFKAKLPDTRTEEKPEKTEPEPEQKPAKPVTEPEQKPTNPVTESERKPTSPVAESEEKPGPQPETKPAPQPAVPAEEQAQTPAEQPAPVPDEESPTEEPTPAPEATPPTAENPPTQQPTPTPTETPPVQQPAPTAAVTP